MGILSRKPKKRIELDSRNKRELIRQITRDSDNRLKESIKKQPFLTDDSLRYLYGPDGLITKLKEQEELNQLKEKFEEKYPKQELKVKPELTPLKVHRVSVEEVLGEAAIKIAKDVNSNCIVSIENKECDIENKFIKVLVVVFRKEGLGFKRQEYFTQMRPLEFGSIAPIRELLMEAVNKNYLWKGDRVVCVHDESLGSGYKGLILIFDVDKIFFNISLHHLADNFKVGVVEQVIKLALEISHEGREGKSIGTSFIVGDQSEVMKYTRQLIINPFASLPPDQRKLSDPGIKESIKEFAQLDGAFVINDEGIVISAGSYLNPQSNVELSGLGARHTSAAAMTKDTNSLAVVVSQSGGKVTVFKEGRIIMKLP